MNLPQTDDGILAWEIVKSCAHQLRVGFSGPAGLDFGAVLAFADALGSRSIFLAELLPEIENVILWAHQKEESK